MIEVAHRLWVGTQAEFEDRIHWPDEWAIVQACKDPYHRKALGYTGRSPRPEHPEFFMCVRENRLILNIVDAPDVKYFDVATIDAAVDHIKKSLQRGLNVFVHCNQGKSRSPTIAMLSLAPEMPEQFEEAETEMRLKYEAYEPGLGMRTYALTHWHRYRQGG